jgi:hypothetical protein
MFTLVGGDLDFNLNVYRLKFLALLRCLLF